MSGGPERDPEIDEWLWSLTRSVVEAVGADWDPPEEGRWVQLVFLPSFEPELVITAVESRTGCRWHVHTAQCSLWEQGEPPWVLAPHERAVVEGALSDDEASELWEWARIAQPSDERLDGLDGMTIGIRHRLEVAVAEFQSWSPSQTAPERRLVEGLLRRVVAARHDPVSSIAQVTMRYLG